MLNSVNAGWNVIDTAANYRWGRAEAAIGEAVQALRSGPGISTIQRSMLFISTKAGFMDRELLAAAGMAEGTPDVADGMHCVHPRCLGASLGRSLRSLKLATVRWRKFYLPWSLRMRILVDEGSCSACSVCASLELKRQMRWHMPRFSQACSGMASGHAVSGSRAGSTHRSHAWPASHCFAEGREGGEGWRNLFGGADACSSEPYSSWSENVYCWSHPVGEYVACQAKIGASYAGGHIVPAQRGGGAAAAARQRGF